MPTPSTGTFTAIGTSVSLLGNTAWLYTIISDMLGVYTKGSADTSGFAQKDTPANYNVAFGVTANPDTTAITLNKGTVNEETVAYNSLPAGFTVTALNIKATVLATVAGTTRLLKFYYNSAEVGNYLNFTGSDVTFTHTVTPTPSTLATFFGTNFGVNADGSGLSGSSTFRIYSIWLEGTYELQNFSWYIKPSIQKVNGKDIVTIASEDDIIQVADGEDPPEGYEFYGTDDDYPDGPLFVYWESNEEYLFFIYSPIDPSFGDIVWTMLPGAPTCDGCITVAMGALEVLLANASGIYTLVTNKTSDSLYTRESFSVFVDTIDVKIPNPTIRFGFIP